MRAFIKTKFPVLGLMALIATAPGCGLFGWLDREDDYKRSEQRPPLEVPPDLSEPVNDQSLAVPDNSQLPADGTESLEPPDLDNSPLPEAPEVDLPKDQSGTPYLVLQDTVESAWRRTGLALQRTGFVIEKRDEARRLYTVRYRPPAEEEEEGGFFSWLFGGDDEDGDKGRDLYQVSVVGSGESESRVTVLDESGAPQTGGTAERILALLADRLG